MPERLFPDPTFPALRADLFEAPTRDRLTVPAPAAHPPRILMLYGSANRDERAIERPDELDLTRPSDHMAFGIGPHFCLGANLARMEVRTTFEELLTRLPDITVPEDVVVPRGESSLVLSIQKVPAEFSKCPVAH